MNRNVSGGAGSTPTDTAEKSSRRVSLATLTMALGAFAIGTTEFVSMGLLPQIGDGVGVGPDQAGAVIYAYAFGVVLGTPLLAALAARLPRKGLLMALAGGLAIGNLASAIAPNYETLVGARFLAGFPHGAYFGVAALIATSLTTADRAGRAVSRVMMGLSVAQLVGVPVATYLGQGLGWRSAYWIVVGLSLATVVAVALLVPRQPREEGASVRGELGALRSAPVVLAFLTGAVGFGGMFALNTYVADLSMQVAGMAEWMVPLVLLGMGLGGVVGTAVGGRLADRGTVQFAAMALASMAVLLLALSLSAHWPVAVFVFTFLVVFAASVLALLLQIRLMQVAGKAKMLGAALNHSALNLGNGLGALIGSLVVGAGLGFRAPTFAGAFLATAGLLLLWWSVRVARSRGIPDDVPVSGGTTAAELDAEYAQAATAARATEN